MKKNYIKITLLLFSTILTGQTSKLSNDYISYFENTREIPFLHLNKTTFLQGEEIWFKAYVQEQNSQKLHPTTSNLYISIFDAFGTLKDQQLIHVKNGLGNGNILLDSTYTNNDYYIKASTQWMKNFKEDNAFYQRIKIASTKQLDNTITTEKDFFEFKLFPEGGHIIANTVNNIGFLIKDANNKGVQIEKGIIKDQNGKTVRQFVTNKFGMNSVRLFFKEDEPYTFHATLTNGSEIKTKTPKPKQLGIALIVNNKAPEKLAINIVSNIQTLKILSGKQYNILVHNTRNFKNFPFTFNEKKLNHALVLQKKQLESGINIITVFDEDNTPIAERLIYLYSNNLFTNFNVSSKKVSNDSLQINFTNPTNEKIYASASFLPSNTIAYQPKNNIISSFLLKPYVKGAIQNPSEYFKGSSKKQQRNLDLLLLTQGWSKYKWNTIFNNSSSIKYAFENGIDITAKVNKGLTNKQSILLYSRDNNLTRVLQPKEQPWVIKNSFIKKNSIIDFALLSNQNLYKISPFLSYSSNTLPETFNSQYSDYSENIMLEVVNFKSLKSDYETLDEIEVQANQRKKFDNDEKVYGSNVMFRRKKMENRIITSGETVLDFLKAKGFYDYSTQTIVPRGLFGSSATKTTETRQEESISEGDDRFGRPLLRIFLDGQDISQNHWMIPQIYLNTVKEIYYGRNSGKLGEEIYIFTLSPIEYEDRRAKYTHITVPVGFATAKEYYNPKYPSFTDTTYQKYGATFWNPNISIAPNGKLDFNIPANMQKHIDVYIEGISESGKLISKKYFLSKDSI